MAIINTPSKNVYITFQCKTTVLANFIQDPEMDNVRLQFVT